MSLNLGRDNPTTTCPFCGAEVVGGVPAERAHMERLHRDIIAARLRDAGEHEQARQFETPYKSNREKFFDRIEETCREFGYSISHEDGHGAFMLETLDQLDFNMLWLRNAMGPEDT